MATATVFLWNRLIIPQVNRISELPILPKAARQFPQTSPIVRSEGAPQTALSPRAPGNQSRRFPPPAGGSPLRYGGPRTFCGAPSADNEIPSRRARCLHRSPLKGREENQISPSQSPSWGIDRISARGHHRGCRTRSLCRGAAAPAAESYSQRNRRHNGKRCGGNTGLGSGMILKMGRRVYYKVFDTGD
jgi:hypothetical protein